MGRRLPDFDYSSRRIYEITVILEERRAVLGRLVKVAAALSGAGSDGLARSPTGGRVPHWAEGYVDTILFGRGQLEKMVNYLRDNPRRLGVKREHPELFKVACDLGVSLGPAGVGHFTAIGNHILLARHELRQVQVSRRFFAYRRDERGKILRDAPPVVSTAAFAAKLAEALSAAKRGAVWVSPCVSEGEREIARQAFALGGRVITLQNKGFSPHYKPGGKLFETCANGNLLMLAPAAWPYQVNEKPMTRIDATAMNRLAQWIAGEGAVEIDYKGMRPDNIDELARAAAKVDKPI